MNSFLSLTDWATGEPIYLDRMQIAFIQQIAADANNTRRTRIDMLSGKQTFIVSEEASQIALASCRGFDGPKDHPQR
jgi:hypothetical protein